MMNVSERDERNPYAAPSSWKNAVEVAVPVRSRFGRMCDGMLGGILGAGLMRILLAAAPAGEAWVIVLAILAAGVLAGYVVAVLWAIGAMQGGDF